MLKETVFQINEIIFQLQLDKSHVSESTHQVNRAAASILEKKSNRMGDSRTDSSLPNALA